MGACIFNPCAAKCLLKLQSALAAHLFSKLKSLTQVQELHLYVSEQQGVYDIEVMIMHASEQLQVSRRRNKKHKPARSSHPPERKPCFINSFSSFTFLPAAK